VFPPPYQISAAMAKALMRIEAAREAVDHLPITPRVVASLRATARLDTTHYSTKIEGNALSREEVRGVIADNQRQPDRERDEAEVLGYYAALNEAESLAEKNVPIAEIDIRRLHALLMNGGREQVKPTPYRDGQNVIRDSATGRIVYMPPEAAEVGPLMRELVDWLQSEAATETLCPLRAGLAHYQIATIHPYFDGNGRLARLLTTLVLHRGGYGLKGLYSLEAYYAQQLNRYYAALDLGPSHNDYLGRTETDVTPWLAYFCEGMAHSFERVKARAAEAAGAGSADRSKQMRLLDARQRRVMTLFQSQATVTANELAPLFQIKPRTARVWCRDWVEAGFLRIVDPARRSRKYALAERWEALIE